MVALLVLALPTSNAVPVTDENWSGIKEACIRNANYKTLEEVLTLDDCKAKCVEETGIVCASIDYNPKSHKCNLCELTSDYSGYLEPCHSNGWLFTERKTAVDENWTGMKEACIKNANYKTLENVSSIYDCKAKCVEETGILCMSIDYNPNSRKCNFCELKSDFSGYMEPCHTNGWLHTERNIAVDENWTGMKEACIRNNNYKTLEEVLSIADCKAKCVDETGILCMSIDYNPKQHKCNLCELKSDSSDYMEPCHSNGWLFSERVGIDEPDCEWPNGQIYWPHPSDCHMFIQCTPHGPQEMSCAPGTAWSQSLLTCDHEANVDCSSPPPSCPEPFKMRGDECFFVTEDGIEPLNWDDSRQKCLDMGADLAMPHDMVDFVAYIKESYPDSKSTIWLGATDREVEQEWKWVSGEPVPAEMWKPWPDNQPSGDGNCMEVHYWPRTDFYMNDWHCNRKGHYACEYDMGA